MILAVLAPLTGLLLGYGLLRFMRAPWPPLALLAAGQVVGSPLVTLLAFGLLEAGVPLTAGLAWSLLAFATLVFGLALRVPATERMRWSHDLGPLAISVAFAALVLLHLLDGPTPYGDGIGNFGMKARFFHGEGTVWTFLRDPRLFALHLDYPLHVPLGMNLGYLFTGSTSGLAGLAADAPVMPAACLFAGVMAARHSLPGGLLAGVAFAAVPAVHRYATAGYADPPLAALFLVAGVALCGRRPVWLVAGVATGLLSWVKLEGIFLGGLLGVTAGAMSLARRQLPLNFFLPAALLGGIWPLTLHAQDMIQKVAEDVAGATPSERLQALASGFGRLVIDPAEVFGFVLVPAILAAAAALKRPSLRPAAALGLAGLALYPLITWLRNTALVHLSGGVPIRLYLQILPLLLFVLGSQLARGESRALRSGATTETE